MFGEKKKIKNKNPTRLKIVFLVFWDRKTDFVDPHCDSLALYENQAKNVCIEN